MTRRQIERLPSDTQGIVRLIRNLIVGLVVALLILGGAVIGTYLRGEDTRNIVTRSACARYDDDQGDSVAFRECAEQRATIARGEPLRNPCISYQRVTGERGHNCRRDYLARRRSSAIAEGPPPAAAAAAAEESPDGQAPPSAPAGTEHQAAPHPSGSGHPAHEPSGGSEPSPAPGDGGSEGAAVPPGEAAPPAAETPAADEAPGRPEGALSALGGTAEEAVKGAGEVVGGLVEGLDCSLSPRC